MRGSHSPDTLPVDDKNSIPVDDINNSDKFYKYKYRLFCSE